LNAFADYGYFLSKISSQQLAKLETLGYSAELSLSFTVFDRKAGKIREFRNAKIEVGKLFRPTFPS